MTLLALFGALTAGLGIKERSVGAAGDRIDGWISTAWNTVTGAAEGADDEAAEAIEQAGDAVEGASDEAAEGLTN